MMKNTCGIFWHPLPSTWAYLVPKLSSKKRRGRDGAQPDSNADKSFSDMPRSSKREVDRVFFLERPLVFHLIQIALTASVGR